jgi:hypothetical protein
MALITVDSLVSIDANSYTFGVNGVAGVAITAGAACTIDTVTGKARPANNTDVFVGFAGLPASVGYPVVMYRIAKIASYSSSMTPGTKLYMAGAGDEGKLSDAPIVATDPAVAIVVTGSDLIVA